MIETGTARPYELRPAWDQLQSDLHPTDDHLQALTDKAMRWGLGASAINLANTDQGVLHKWAVLKDGVLGTGNVLGVVGDRYTLIPNDQAFEPVTDFCKASGGKITRLFQFGNGEKICMLVTLPDFEVLGEAFANYGLFTTTHDGSGATTFRTIVIRLACQSHIHVGKTHPFKVRHTATGPARLKVVGQLMEANAKAIEQLGSRAKLMATWQMTHQAKVDILDELAPMPSVLGRAHTAAANVREAILDIYDNAKNLDYVRGSALSFLYAVAQYNDHIMTGRETRNAREENRAARILFTPNMVDKCFDAIWSYGDWTEQPNPITNGMPVNSAVQQAVAPALAPVFSHHKAIDIPVGIPVSSEQEQEAQRLDPPVQVDNIFGVE